MKKKVLIILTFTLAFITVTVVDINAVCRPQRFTSCDDVNNKALYSNPQGTEFCCSAMDTYNCSAADCNK